MRQLITFTIDDAVVFKVGEVFQPGGTTRRYQVLRKWTNMDGKIEYEARCIDLNRKQLRRRVAIERKTK